LFGFLFSHLVLSNGLDYFGFQDIWEGTFMTSVAIGSELFGSSVPLPDYQPRLAPLFWPRQIILAKGSISTPARRDFVDRICAVYPRARVIDQSSIPHNKIVVEGDDPLELHYRGHRTLVFAEHASALGRSDETGNTCPNFWHFSPYGYCPYGCQYCYLAGTQGIRFSPTVKIFLNLGEILDQIDRQSRKLGRPEAFYLGKLQDGMALDPLTGYSRYMIPFFARHPFARLRILSKSADFTNVLDLNHGGHTVLCWSLNPPVVRKDYEAVTPPVENRISAMKQCADAGYPVRVMLMPIIPIADWERHYDELLEQILSQVTLDRLTLGGICSYGPALDLMDRKLGKDNLISRSLFVVNNAPQDGRARYSAEVRGAIYSHLLATIRRYQPELTCALCMEDVALAESLGLGENIGRCNCIL
jgi:spore photoproduct lyase